MFFETDEYLIKRFNSVYRSSLVAFEAGTFVFKLGKSLVSLSRESVVLMLSAVGETT